MIVHLPLHRGASEEGSQSESGSSISGSAPAVNNQRLSLDAILAENLLSGILTQVGLADPKGTCADPNGTCASD